MIATIEDALLQYNTEIADLSTALSLKRAKEAILYLLVNRAVSIGHGQQNINYESLKDLLKMIDDKLTQYETVPGTNWTRFRGRNF